MSKEITEGIVWRWEMGQRLKEYRPGKVRTVEVRALVNDDRTRIEGIGITRENVLRLLYTDRDISLKILVTRYDVNGKEALDAYTVMPDPPLFFRRLAERGELGLFTVNKLNEMKQHIESALKVWPQIADNTNPVSKVQFRHFDLAVQTANLVGKPR
jgi:hypothetical protein